MRSLALGLRLCAISLALVLGRLDRGVFVLGAVLMGGFRRVLVRGVLVRGVGHLILIAGLPARDAGSLADDGAVIAVFLGLVGLVAGLFRDAGPVLGASRRPIGLVGFLGVLIGRVSVLGVLSVLGSLIGSLVSLVRVL